MDEDREGRIVRFAIGTVIAIAILYAVQWYAFALFGNG